MFGIQNVNMELNLCFFKISSKYTWQILKAWGLAPIPQGAVHGVT